MKRISLFYLLLFCVTLANAQSVLWHEKYGGQIGSPVPVAISVDANGSTFTGGYFWNSMVYNHATQDSLISAGQGDGFLMKTDAFGIAEWAISLGDSNYSDQVYDVKANANGNVYVSGIIRGTVDFDPGPGTASYSSGSDGYGYLAKYSTTGDLLWVNVFEGDYVVVNSITLGAGDNVFITGNLFDSVAVDMDPGPGTQLIAGQAGYFAGYNPSGDLLYATAFPGFVHCTGLDFDNAGNQYVAGYFRDTVDFDPGPGIVSDTSQNTFSTFFLKFDPNGDYLWHKTIDGNWDGDVFVADIAVSQPGEIYLTGKFILWGITPIDFDPGPGSETLGQYSNEGDMYFVKFDVNGDFQWVKHYAGEHYGHGVQVEVGSGGSIYLLGNTGSHSGVAISEEITIYQFGAAGDTLWSHSFWGADLDGSTEGGFCITPTGTLYLTGHMAGTINLPNNLQFTADGNWDMFSVKIGSLPIQRADALSESDCNVFPNPVLQGNVLRVQSRSTGTLAIRVSDVRGRTLARKSGRGNITFTTEKWERGLYFVEIHSDSGREVRKVIVR